MTEEIDLNELEARLRDKWQPDAFKPAVDAEAMAVARQIMDKSNARRLGRTRRGHTFRYRQPVRTAEYFFAPPTYFPHSSIEVSPGGWTINTYLDGRKHTSTTGLTLASCMRIVRLMGERGIKAHELVTEGMRAIRAEAAPATPSKQQQPSRRLAILNELSRFRA